MRDNILISEIGPYAERLLKECKTNEINELNKKISQIKSQKADLQHKLDIKMSTKKCDKCEHQFICNKNDALLYRNDDGSWFCDDWEEIEDK